ncbi:MAG: sulfite exporter TauE/SafE family protein, partial [Clostridiales bacterium]|nr:sulfite exporter TauE/SafE family protein [Clostridiales bacterium]
MAGNNTNKKGVKKAHEKPVIITVKIYIDGMTCLSCENAINAGLKTMTGVRRVGASYATNSCEIVFDGKQTSKEAIFQKIEDLGYVVLTAKQRRNKYIMISGLAITAAAVYLILQNTVGFGVSNISQETSLFMLFVIGLLSSVHCVAMCGGICISQTITQKKPGDTDPAQETANADGEGGDKALKRFVKVKPAVLYNAGRVVSYTVVGLLVGLIGSTLTFSSVLQGVIKIIAGVIMLL